MIIAYIDYQNISRGFEKLGFEVNRKRLYIYLKDKYKSQKMSIFMGYISNNENKYQELRTYGYHIYFRDAILGEKGRIKANIDTDLVLQSSRDFYENKLSKGILVSCDGDFDCLIRFRYEKGIFGRLFCTKQGDISLLLKKYTKPLDYNLYDGAQKTLFRTNKKGPIKALFYVGFICNTDDATLYLTRTTIVYQK